MQDLCYIKVYSRRLASGHVNQVGHLPKRHLNLLEIHEIGAVDTSESKKSELRSNMTHVKYVKSISTVIRAVPRQLTVPLTCCELYMKIQMYIFAIFINDLASEMKQLDIGIDIKIGNTCILLFADDIVILAEDEIKLQIFYLIHLYRSPC